MPSSPRARSRSRTRGSGRFYAPASSGGGGGGGIGSGPTLLKAYATAVGTDEASPRVITFDTPSTPGRNIFAIQLGSSTVTMPAPWTSVSQHVSGTVSEVFTVSKANNTGLTSVSVTRTGTVYPFAMAIFEDDVLAMQTGPTVRNVAPSAGTWSSNSATYTNTWQVIGWWGAQTYQSAPTAAITAYNNGLTEFGDTGASSVFASDHGSWYSNRIWLAKGTGLSGSQTLTATTTGAAGTGWVRALAYTVG